MGAGENWADDSDNLQVPDTQTTQTESTTRLAEIKATLPDCHSETSRPERTSWRGGGEGVLNKCLQYREAPPQGPTPHPFTIFHEKGTSFVYLLLRKGTLLKPC